MVLSRLPNEPWAGNTQPIQNQNKDKEETAEGPTERRDTGRAEPLHRRRVTDHGVWQHPPVGRAIKCPCHIGWQYYGCFFLMTELNGDQNLHLTWEQRSVVES